MEFTCWICGLAIYNRDYPVPDPIMNCHPEWKKARASHERQFGDKPFSYHLDATALNISLSDEVWKSLFRMSESPTFP